MEAELKMLSERKRRAFFRCQDKDFADEEAHEISEKEANNFEDKEEEDEEVEEEERVQDVDIDGRLKDLLVMEAACQNNCEHADRLDEYVDSGSNLSDENDHEDTKPLDEDKKQGSSEVS